MRLEMERRIWITSNKIYREIDVDEDGIDETFGGRIAHKKKRVRVIKERTVQPEDLDLRPTKTDQGLLSLMDNLEKKYNKKPEATKEIDGRYLWYPEMGKHLVDATKSIATDEDKALFDERKKTALAELEKRIPEINKIINEFKFQIYWAGKVLNGFNGSTPFGDSQKALDFLRENLGIDKNGVDKYKEDRLDKSEKKGLDNEKKAEEMSFEDKIERVKNSGGTLVEAYKRYVLSGIKPDNFDYVISQVKQAFPFDVVELAEEWKRKIKEESNNMSKPESEAASWEVTYEDNVLFQSLKQVADKEMWQKKVEELSGLDEVTRKNKLDILMALIKIKSEGVITEEGQRLWNSKKNRLEELGLMI